MYFFENEVMKAKNIMINGHLMHISLLLIYWQLKKEETKKCFMTERVR